MGHVAPLPADYKQWSPTQVANKKREYGEHLQNLIAINNRGEKLPPGDATIVSDALDALEVLANNQKVSHAGMFPPDKGARPTQEPDWTKFGQLKGVGAAFLSDMKMKAALDGTSGGSLVPAWYDPQIRDLPQRAMFVRSLIPTVTVSGDKVDYMQQSAFTNSAAAVAAGALKPKSVITLAKLTAPVQTIAHISEALDRSLMSDEPQLVRFLDDQLRLGVLLEEERQILLGDGVAPNLAGILSNGSIQVQAKGADPVPDAILKAITKVRLTFVEPDGIVLHPNDYQDVRMLRTADGEYIFGVPALNGPEKLWGLNVVQSPLITEGTGLVGSFGTGCMVYDREQARVSFAETGLGDSAGQELFSRNQLRWRGESRLAFAIFKPTAFCKVTGI